MKNIIYRVMLRVSWYEAYFEFDNMDQACSFATTALQHNKGCDDTKKTVTVGVQVVDVDAERAAKEEKARKEAEEKARKEAEEKAKEEAESEAE